MSINRTWSPRRWAERVIHNAKRLAEHRWAEGIVILLEVGACTILPIPMALMMMGLVSAAPRKWLRFGLSATVGSVTGAFILYVIGRAFFYSLGQRLISLYGGEARWANIVEWFNSEWGLVFIALVGITTGMLRVASIGAGFTGMNPLAFLAVLAISRCARWVAECAAIRYVGDRVRNWPRHYFEYATVGAVLLLFAALIAFSFVP